MALPRLIFITGKGGTGKSTVAAALGHALARKYPVTVADIDRRASAARLLGVDLNGRGSAHVGKQLEVRALSPRAELESFIERIVPLKMVSRRMLKSRTFGYVTAALPGLEAFLMLDRLRILAEDAAREGGYLVIDGPASGTTLELLSVAGGLGALATNGLLHRLARELEKFLTDPESFGVLITSTAEEASVREALETASVLDRRMRVRRVGVILNGATGHSFSRAESELAATLGEHGRLMERRIELGAIAERARGRLGGAGLGLIELPMLFRASLGKKEIFELSQTLESTLAHL
ncbi:MAG TPA: ArsA-related P-loop ATPase [Candidatus Binataceae bacterium]|nr:ArsA-related P-loop ATPase [Candidatus Binataceae bacterium]